MYITICEIDCQSRFDAWDRVFRAGVLGWPWGMEWGEMWEGGLGWRTQVHSWLIHVNVWQIPPQQYKAISFRLKLIHKKKVMVFPVVTYRCELDYKESQALKNWCFWTVVLEKTLEGLLDCEEIQPVLPKGTQSWIFIGRTEAEAETPIFVHQMWSTDSFEKTLLLERLKAGG